MTTDIDAKDIDAKDKALFVKRLKMAMTQKDISRKQLSKTIGANVASLNNIFLCKPISSTRMNALRRATGTSEIDFIMLAPGDES